MVLKKVVLPAPFGPIRLTMAPRGMVKSTLFTATRPPKRLVISTARSKSLPPGPVSLMAAPPAATEVSTTLLTMLNLSPSARVLALLAGLARVIQFLLALTFRHFGRLRVQFGLAPGTGDQPFGTDQHH